VLKATPALRVLAVGHAFSADNVRDFVGSVCLAMTVFPRLAQPAIARKEGREMSVVPWSGNVQVLSSCARDYFAEFSLKKL
jgi:hypothetical protein